MTPDSSPNPAHAELSGATPASPTVDDSRIPLADTPLDALEALVALQAGACPLPDYELVCKLGAGGMGEVWRARGPGGVEVALKFIRLADRAGATELRSLEFMKAIHHPNLIGLSGAWQRDGLLILALELGECTLLHRLEEAQAQDLAGIPPLELLRYMHDAARGIDFLNEPTHLNESGKLLGIQHRDIKPQNLLLVGGGVKVADFGLAKLLGNQATLNSGLMTPAYAAPEFIAGKTVNQSDQYSLAITYCQLRGGRLPFIGSAMQIMKAHLEAEPDLTMLPESERPVVARALAKEPTDRWPSCLDFVVALAGTFPEQNGVTRSGILRARAPKPQPAARTSPRPGRGRSLALQALVLLLLLLPVAWLVLHPRNATPSAPAPEAHLELPAFKEVVLFPGQTFNLKVSVKRQHCPDPLELRLEELPAGVQVEPVSVPEAEESGRLLIRVAPDAPAATRQATLAVSSPRQVAARVPVPLRISGPLEKEIGNSVGMTLVRIPAGQFVMGSPAEEPQRHEDEQGQEVLIRRPFYLGIHEVTQRQYLAVMGRNPSFHKQPELGLDFPVENVTWEEATEFCGQLSVLAAERAAGRVYRLPWEAEWEYACRGGTAGQEPFHLGDDLEARQANFNGNFPYGKGKKGAMRGKTTPVGLFRPNGFGLFDMHGNVSEWCGDWYCVTAHPEPAGETGTCRVVRGGSWAEAAANCRCAVRGQELPGQRHPFIGFRVLMTLEEK